MNNNPNSTPEPEALREGRKSRREPERVELKPYRQTWLSRELMHSAPSAHLCVIDGDQWVQLEHPRGGPLTCVKNRTGKTASAVVRVDGKWYFEFAIPTGGSQ